MRDFILAIDGGQTSTMVWLGACDEEQAWRAKAPGFSYGTEPDQTKTNQRKPDQPDNTDQPGQLGQPNPHDQQTKPDQMTGIKTAVANLMSQAGCTPDNVRAICCSLSGHPPGLREYLEQTFLTAQIRYVEDREAAFAGTLWQTPGVALVGGTGSVAFGYNGQQTLFIGGWGYLFGDAGGGWGIAQRGLMAAIAAEEQRGPVSELPKRLLQHFQAANLRELAWSIYGGQLARRELGHATPIVLELAEKGDAGALGVALTAAAEYAGYISSLRHRLHLNPPFPVGYTGGVLMGSQYLRQLIEHELEQQRITISAWVPGSALAGSALLAMQAAGYVVTPDVQNRIQRLTAGEKV